MYGILERYGLANLILATAMSGLMLFAMGLFKLGTLVRFIPVAVILGFTNGIAVLIALSQIKDFLGLQIQSMPASFFGMVQTLAQSAGSFNGVAAALACASLLAMLAWQWLLPRWSPTRLWVRRLALVPGSVVALVLATGATTLWQLPVETVGSRFGGIPSSLPALAWPGFSWESARFLFIPAATLALLGAIESLLCARIADGILGDRHNPNQELMAQGIANFVTPFFGGMPATGTIARTVANVKSGASSPVAGMVHAFTLLLVVLVAAPWARHIPLAAMAAILMFVAWNMGEWREFWNLRQFRLPYRITFLAVFALTVVFDLTVAVEVGLVAACITFIYRISSLSRCEPLPPADWPAEWRPESEPGGYAPADPGPCAPRQWAAYRLHGALFFGAVQLVEDLRDSLPQRGLLLDMSAVIYVDSSGADALLDLARCCRRDGVELRLCGLGPQPLDIARRCGLLSWVDSEFNHHSPGEPIATETPPPAG